MTNINVYNAKGRINNQKPLERGAFFKPLKMDKATFKIKPEEGVHYYRVGVTEDSTFLSIEFDIWGINLTFIGSFYTKPLSKTMEFYLVNQYSPKPFAHLIYLGTFIPRESSEKYEVYGVAPPHTSPQKNISTASL